jgi:hypothetical protein
MSGAARPTSRVALACAWSHAVNPTAELPIPREIMEECLYEWVDRVVDTIKQEPFTPEPVAEAAATLVARGITGDQSLGRTIEVLGRFLPALPELSALPDLTDRVASILGALVTGYSIALRRRSFAERQAWFRATPRRWAWC